MRRIGLILCLLVFATFASADQITRDLTPVPEGLVLPSHPTRAGDCELGLAVVGAAYYFDWGVDEGFKLYVDPATDQTFGECTTPYYPMQVNSVGFYLYFFADCLEVVGKTLCMEVDVECPKNMGTSYPDKCNGPGPAICTEMWCHTFTGEEWSLGDVYFDVPFTNPCCVNGPFFFGVRQVSWDGTEFMAPGMLSELAQIPNQDCRVWSRFGAVSGGITYPPCWFNVSADYVTPWGPWLMYAQVTSEAQCEPVICQPCPPVYPGDDVSNPIMIDTAPWSRTINLCDYCPDYDQRIEYPGGSFSGAGPDVVLELAYPAELPEVCFTITIVPQCENPTFFRIRSWISDEFGAFYLGNPNFPAVGASQTYNFTAAGLGCLPNTTYWLYIDTRNNYCCCPVVVTYTGDTPLPVELSTFEAIAGDRQVTLNWTTASELNNDYFEVQRNLAGNWTTLGQVDGAGTSVIARNYSYTDHAVVNGVTYTYRLLSHDINGIVHEYGATVEATPGAPTPTEYALSQNYPNPFNPQTSITYAVKEAGFVTLKVYNLMGQEVATLVSAKMSAGHYTASFAASDLPSGIYVYRLEVNDFTAQKKMVLLK